MKNLRETELKRTARGYRRFVGGERFDLGHDRSTAEKRRDAILALWEANCRELGFNSGPFRPSDRKPYWLPHNLEAANAIRKGVTPVVESGYTDPETYLERIEALSQLTGLDFAAADQDKAKTGYRDRREAVTMAAAAVTKHTGQTFFQALDAYGEAIKFDYNVAGQITDHGRTKLDRLRIIKSYCPDCDLGQLDLQRCDELYAAFRNRPNTKRYKKPMSFKFAADMANEVRNFCDWLHLSKVHFWRKPEDFGALKRTPRVLAFPYVLADGLCYLVLELGAVRVIGRVAEPKRVAYTCKADEDGDFQFLDLRTPFCTIDDIGGVPPSDADDPDPAS